MGTVSSQQITVKVERIGNTVTLDIPSWKLNTISFSSRIFSIKIDPKYRPTQDIGFVATVQEDEIIFGKVTVKSNGNVVFGTLASSFPFLSGVMAGFLHTGISYIVD